MDRKTIGIIATLATVLCCGCPGLSACLFGVLTLFGVGTYNIDVPGSTGSGALPPAYGAAVLCMAVILIAIPIVVGIVTLRKPKGTGINPSGDMPSGL